MSKLFRRILVPIDFTEGSEVAVKKAIQLADPFESVICLLYICKPLFSMNIFSNTGYLIAPAAEILTESEIRRNIGRYISMINDNTDGVKVETVISEYGKIQKKIENTAIQFQPDLIIICKHGNKSHLPFLNYIFPHQIATNTDCPVLTIKQGSGINRIRNIVLPVTRNYPERKLEVAIKIARTFNANIHLITFPENDTGDETKEQSFIKSFTRLRENSSLSIKHGPVAGHDIARAILRYAEFHHADMILANPSNESTTHSFTGKKHISDLLDEESMIQVLDIQPYLTTI